MATTTCRLGAGAIAASFVATLLLMAVPSEASVYTLMRDGARHEVETIQRQGIDWLALGDLARAVGASLVEADQLVTLDLEGSQVELTLASNQARLDGEPVRFSRAALATDGQVWVPADFVTGILAAASARAAEARRRAAEVLSPTVAAQEVVRVELQVKSNRDYTRVIISCPGTRVLPYTINAPSGRIVARLQADNLAAPEVTSVADGAIEEIRFERSSGRGTFTFDLGPDYRDHQTAVLPDPFRVVVDVYRRRPYTGRGSTVAEVAPGDDPEPEPDSAPVRDLLQAATLPGEGTVAPEGERGATADLSDLPAEGATAEIPERVLANLRGRSGGGFRTIVIDPGHGGSAPGARGPTNLLEKDLTLDLARRLATKLERGLGVRVVLTRKIDTYLPLEQRTSIANNEKADLFLSIHANASRRGDARGAETYILAASATDDEWRTHNATETGAVDEARGMEGTDLELILWSLAQNQYLRESEALGEVIQRQLNATLGVKDRGVKQAPFTVLVGATMPAVLVEVGFISNPVEEQRLRDEAYKNRIVNALYESIRRFKQARSGVKMGALEPTR